MDMDVVHDYQEAKARGHQPCAACRMLRRRCDSKCFLAPYFPTDDVDKFVGVHKVFGACNVIKMIQTVEETKREDAVKAIVYEAVARVRDPVYGSAGSIFQLQKMIEGLKAELELIKSRVSEVREQKDQLLSIIHNNTTNKTTTTITNTTTYGHQHLDDPLVFPITMNKNIEPAIMFDGRCSTTLSVDDVNQLMNFDCSLLEFDFPAQVVGDCIYII